MSNEPQAPVEQPAVEPAVETVAPEAPVQEPVVEPTEPAGPVEDNVADVAHSDYHKREDETQAEYNERVPVGLQPVQPGPTTSYLGAEL